MMSRATMRLWHSVHAATDGNCAGCSAPTSATASERTDGSAYGGMQPLGFNAI